MVQHKAIGAHCFSIHADRAKNQVVLEEQEVVAPGTGDAIHTPWGRTVRTSLRRVREVARFPLTDAGQRKAKDAQQRLTTAMYPNSKW